MLFGSCRASARGAALNDLVFVGEHPIFLCLFKLNSLIVMLAFCS